MPNKVWNILTTQIYENIVTWQLKAGRVAHEEVPIARNGMVNWILQQQVNTWWLKARIVEWVREITVRQWHNKNISLATNTDATIEDAVFWVSERQLGASNHSSLDKEWPVLVRTLLSSKRKPHFKTRKSWERKKNGHGSQAGPKPRMTVLARASRNLLDWTVYQFGDGAMSSVNSCKTYI
jgi:hypothetical protein